MLDFKDIDAVVIATPCYLHAEMAAAALQAGKYVYCEKPMGITPEQVQTGAECVARGQIVPADRSAAPLFPVVREAVRQVHSGDLLGRTLVIKAQRDSLPLSPEAEARRPAWYKDVRYSGDLIVENAIHNIDVCNWIANSRPVAAFGHGMKYFPQPRWAGREMMDGFSVEYVYLNGIHLDYSQLYMHPRGLRRMTQRPVVRRLWAEGRARHDGRERRVLRDEFDAASRHHSCQSERRQRERDGGVLRLHPRESPAVRRCAGWRDRRPDHHHGPRIDLSRALGDLG